jgi:hypothetical protein
MNWFNVIKYTSKNFFFKKAEEELASEYIEKINEYIIEDGYPPYWAREWAKSKLESGKAPEEWISAINKTIFESGRPPSWARDWAESKLMSGQAPEEWISGINKFIVSERKIPDWAEEWAKFNLLDERIKMVIKGNLGLQKIRIRQIIDNYSDNR